jgi:hypothetical protein
LVLLRVSAWRRPPRKRAEMVYRSQPRASCL